MSKKKFIVGLIIIIILGIFFQVEFGDYYNTPEEALKHNNDKDTSMKYIIDTVWVENQPIIFYVSNSGDLCEMEFKSKEIFGKLGWKFGVIGTLKTEKIDSNVVVPTRMGSGKINDKNLNSVLFGITKSVKANSIKVNGKYPTLKKFESKGEDYVLWYIIGHYKMNIDNIKITSD